MPITIDTTSGNIEQQLEDINNRIALNKQVDPKYFSKVMTGNSKRKTGLFTNDSHTITGFMHEKRRLLRNVDLNEASVKSQDRHSKQTFSNFFHQSSKETGHEFAKFENNLTTMIPPIILENIISSSTPTALTFPKNIGMYNLNAIESTWVKLVSGTIDGKPATTYVKPVIQSIRLYSMQSKVASSVSGIISNETTISGQPDIYILYATVLDNMDKDGDIIFANQTIGTNGKVVDETQGVASIYKLKERTTTEYDWDELNVQLQSHMFDVIQHSSYSASTITNHQLMLSIGDQSIYDLLTAQATTITHQAEATLLTFIRTFAKRVNELQTKNYGKDILTHLDNGLITFVQHIDEIGALEDDLISTDLLASIFEALKDNLGDNSIINRIARHSLRLLLSQRLHELDDIRKTNGLYSFKQNNKQVKQAMDNDPNYSTQQKRIITTSDPLVIGQAGAGSGKSHTLIGRINYIRDQGDDISKVLVLSFTNVSAININNRLPGVRSETLANMFHTIYTSTFPAQSLSQPSTVANSIRLLNPSSAYFASLGLNLIELEIFIQQFADRLEKFDQTGFKRVDLQQELKRMSNLIESNLVMATHVLDAVEQTTLEIQPIIIHHMLLSGGHNLNVPNEYQNLNYIITDESQDISTFEYILLLELTIHYRSQLLIIGDGSQTLYEFRNSDPRYMNALESSNVFTSHKLETNYRSNEEILMFANQFLQVIDANKYAKIQLQSSSFSTPTQESVRKAINIVDNKVVGSGQARYSESLCDYINEDLEFQDWFLERVRNGEQVSFMGWTRAEVLAVGETIETLLADNGLSHIQITNIMSDNQRPMIILSRFARNKNETIRSLDPTNPQYLDDIKMHIDQFVSSQFAKASSKQSSFYKDYILRNIKEVTLTPEWNAAVNDYRAGKMNNYQVGSLMLQALLKLETAKNRMDQFLRKRKDVPNYDECPILLSTIHGTKGLEFDHSVVMFNESKRGSTTQESLRMMFVALSRAKKSQWIINSVSSSKLRTVTDTQSAMFQTPMSTAFMRTLNDVAKLTNP